MKINTKTINILIFLFILIVLSAENIISGKEDASYDFVFNSAYNGYYILSNRITKDLLPCGIESYLNPYFNIINFQIRLWFDSIPSIAQILYSIPHTILCFFVFLINKELFLNYENKKFYNWILVIIATFLCLSEVTFVSSVGTHFNCIPASACVVAALFLLIKYLKGENTKNLKLIGVLLGVACGMELMACPYFLAIIVAFSICSSHQNLKLFFKNIGIITLFAIISFVIYDGYWAYSLFKYFGNPVFPFFNNIFKSDLMSFVNYQSQYVVTNPLKLLIFPLVWFDNVPPNLQVEMMPFFDLRHIFMYFSTILLCFLVGRQIFLSKAKAKIENLKIEYKIQLFLLIFAITSYILWAQTYCLIRYFIPVLVLCGSFIILPITYCQKLLKNKHLYTFLFCFLFLINFNYKSINWGHSFALVYSMGLDIKENSVIYIVGKFPAYNIIWQNYKTRFINLFASSDDNMPDFTVSEKYLKMVDYHSKNAKHIYVIKPTRNIPKDKLKNNGQYILEKYVAKTSNCKNIPGQYDILYLRDAKENPYDFYNRSDIKKYYDFPKYEICEIK
ncbi:MAG: hypothetical protein MJ229_01680 [bacterium]|nr:hypothetical protein [bacterium]